MYPKELGVKVFRASTLVYFDELFLLSYISELQHSFVSAEGKAESYNETFLNSDNVRYSNKLSIESASCMPATVLWGIGL